MAEIEKMKYQEMKIREQTVWIPFTEGGEGSGIKGHTTDQPETTKQYKPGFKPSEHKFTSQQDLEYNLNDIPSFENLIIEIDGEEYYFVSEDWFPDCLESRNMGETDQSSIQRLYKQIMEQETGLKPDIIGYDKDAANGEYGTSYIAQKVNEAEK